jgi:hypothetical protein
MIRRIVWLIIILWLAYRIYYWIDPVGAQDFMVQIQSYFQKDSTVVSDDMILDQQESQEQQEQQEQPIQQESIVQIDFIENPLYTGTIDAQTLTEFDDVVSDSLPTQVSLPIDTMITEKVPTRQPTTTNTQPKSNTTSNSLSETDKQDIKNLLNAIVE